MPLSFVNTDQAIRAAQCVPGHRTFGNVHVGEKFIVTQGTSFEKGKDCQWVLVRREKGTRRDWVDLRHFWSE